MTSRKTKNPIQTEPRPALSPFDVEDTPEAKEALAGTIGQIVTDFLAKGIRQLAIPTGQVNAVRAAFEAAATIAPLGPTAARRWHVEILKVSGLVTEIRFHTDDDPAAGVPASAMLPVVDDFLAWTRTDQFAALRDEAPGLFGAASALGRHIDSLRLRRAMANA